MESAISYIKFENEHYYKISNSDAMRPFFMTIVSHSDHWMFISSNGGLTAGRKNAEYALFPYYTDDKITEAADVTGSKSIFIIEKYGESRIWEPFSERYEGMYRTTRNLYKNEHGNKVLFEEINHDLQLTFRYAWNSSDKFGFVRKSKLINDGDAPVNVSLLDGIQNIVPALIGSYVQNSLSNLVDAYKRHQLIKESGLGIYALSAVLVDKAEPAEALKANVVWSSGLENPKYLLSSIQVKNFRKRMPLHQEEDVKAEKGAYLLNAEITLSPKGAKEWMIVADVNKNHAAVAEISAQIIGDSKLVAAVEADVEQGTQELIELNAGADALQLSADKFRDTRHFSNTLFNIMRGGIFDNNYQIEKADFAQYLAKASKAAYKNGKAAIDKMGEEFTLSQLKEVAFASDDMDFRRLCLEYMPLKFSRRHGDPSRPWNRFSINTKSEDGSKILDYEGNWRDIFQNWEALAHSYPEFTESMIHKFLNATTFDGYNPYRVTKGGFDWEAIEPDDPWSYIGYWGDHQIIYLLKFLEVLEDRKPGKLESYFDENLFVYANVPYKIKGHEDILKNPKDTIDFDHELDGKIRAWRDEKGADGALLQNQKGAIHKVNFIEKILATVLAKVSNFIPEGGIWMNTQRPEWNDANNALVGNGVSMVTLYYLRRFLKFFEPVFAQAKTDRVGVSAELTDFFRKVKRTLEGNRDLLSGDLNDQQRKTVLDGLGRAAADFRNAIYQNDFSGKTEEVSMKELGQFVEVTLAFLEHSIRANKRSDNLYHAYNLMTVEGKDAVSISYLSEMLEGQVAVLSSGYLDSKEALEALDGLKNSKLFRPDQYSYILYPNKDLPQFTEKNILSENAVKGSKLLTQLVKAGNAIIIEKDVFGAYHFNGNFKNANDLGAALDSLSSGYASLVEKEKEQILQSFEEVFNHKAFTGRSGTFFGYEGLGSIYWHMVSKLQLAVQECCLKAIEEKESAEVIGRLLEHYYEINAGIGVHKPPTLYGAFPTDAYSHTPAGKGAQQPGMTGQVKEDVLCRFGELGVFVKDGKLLFNPCLLRKDEFLTEAKTFDFVDVNGKRKSAKLAAGSLCFTYCQVPMVYALSERTKMEVFYKNGTSKAYDALTLSPEDTKAVFERTGAVEKISVQLVSSELK